MPIANAIATIPAGDSLSNAVDMLDGRCIRIIMPDKWTPANITFQIATLNVPSDFKNVHSPRTGAELMIGCTPDATVPMLGDGEFAAQGFLKLRSGTSERPIVQEADCTFMLVILK